VGVKVGAWVRREVVVVVVMVGARRGCVCVDVCVFWVRRGVVVVESREEESRMEGKKIFHGDDMSERGEMREG
jgi:hypothetical protein